MTDYELSLSPNPSDGAFSIKFRNFPMEGYWVTISDMYGKIVYSSNKISNDDAYFEIGLSAGIYLIQVAGVHGENYCKRKVIIE